VQHVHLVHPHPSPTGRLRLDRVEDADRLAVRQRNDQVGAVGDQGKHVLGTAWLETGRHGSELRAAADGAQGRRSRRIVPFAAGVVEEDGRLVGIVSARDLLGVYAAADMDLELEG
jgi:CBS domain-containing protein